LIKKIIIPYRCWHNSRERYPKIWWLWLALGRLQCYGGYLSARVVRLSRISISLL